MERNIVKKYTNQLRVENYDQAMKIAEQLVNEYLELDYNYAEIARKNSLTRERVAQIYGTIFGDRQFLDKLNDDFNWKALGKLCTALGITRSDVMLESGVSLATITRVLNGTYIRKKKKNKKSTNPSAKIKIMKTVLGLVSKKFKAKDKALDSVEKSIKNMKQNT